jgi:ribosomal protein S18 acetylase RimI-like enzyme
MSDLTPIPLTPIPIGLDSPEFKTIRDWPFDDSYVGRLLRDEIPERMQRGSGRNWIYRDPDGLLVGFGTIDVRDHYRAYTAGEDHPYIPLLAVNPTIKSLGYGTSIVGHLVDEAALLACGPCPCHDLLFLDVYASNVKAIKLYERCGFTKLTDEPIPDPDEDGKPYIIMARRVSVSPA